MKVSRADLFKVRRVVGRPSEVYVSSKYSKNRYKSKTKLIKSEINKLMISRKDDNWIINVLEKGMYSV